MTDAETTQVEATQGETPQAAAQSHRGPHAEYTRRRNEAARDAERWETREKILSQSRLAVFVAGLALGWFAFGTRAINPLWCLPPVAIFIALVVVHDRTIQLRSRAERIVAVFDAGLARLEDRWAGLGCSGDAYREEDHAYCDDLDVFGEGSLFELLCTARTAAGEATLADWLKNQAGAVEVRERQSAIRELSDRLDLRTNLAMLGEDVRTHFNPTSLIDWGADPPRHFARALRGLAAGATTLTSLAAALWIFSDAGAVPFVAALGLQSAYAASLRKRVAPILARATAPTRDLALLRGLLERLESEPFECERLRALRAALDCEGAPPSKQIARLQRLVDLLDARGNQFFAPIGALLMWGTHVGIAIESWRSRVGPRLEAWIEAAGEIEALCALGGHAFENPDDPFPKLEDSGPIFEGRELGHPLLPRAGCVRNGLTLGREPQGYIMSGSNMSGKSTMLRTVGTNAILALAGAPVRAESLRISPLAIAASIQVSDSLQRGTSHFYAEIQRLRQVVELTGHDRPVLFLLDEILHGTNSHDRRIGATAVVRGLIEAGAIGIVTTHDLALAKIVDDLAPRMRNVHFADHLEDGQMTFDYQLREGVVSKSNAIALMRSVGLKV